MGKSYAFEPTAAGYAQAEAQARSIADAGHRVGGDTSRIAYQQSGGRTNVFDFGRRY